MERYVRFVLRRRIAVLAFCAVLTGLLGWALTGAQLESSLGRMFLGEDPRFERYRELTARFGTDEILAVGIEDPELFTLAGQERLRATVAALESHDAVEKVVSLLDAFYLEPGLIPRPVRYLDAARADPTQIPALRERLAREPSGLLLGKGGTSMALLVNLSPKSTGKAESIPGMVASVLEVTHAHYPPERVHPAGTPALVAEVFKEVFRAIGITTPLVAVFLLGTVWLLFGRLWPAGVSLTVAGVAMVWTLGVGVLIEPRLNVMTASVPAVILIISFSDIVHLCSAYLLELGKDPSPTKEEAIVASATEVGRACLFTSVTTFVGFACLSFLPVPVFRVLGIVLGLGVGVALALAVTLVPILFSFLPAPPPLLAGATTRRVQGALDGLLSGCMNLALKRPWTVHLIFVAATGIAIYGTWNLEIETDFKARLSENNQARQDTEWFQDNFVTADAIQVYVKPPTAGQLDDPDWLIRLASFRVAVEGLDGVERVTSLLDLIEQIDHALPGASGERFPTDPARIRGVLRLLKFGGGERLRPLVDYERGRLRVLVHPRGTGMREIAQTGRQIEALAAEHFGPETKVEASGLLALFGGFLDVVVEAQKEGLLISCFTIALLMMIGLRSFRAGLLSMLPNLLPLGVLTACLGLLWDRVDSDAFALTYIALGIGVDDTIHFLVRYRLEVRRHEPVEALRRTFSFAGRGIVMTTLILSLGFLPFLLSDYFFMQMLGSLLPLCFVVALAADLLWIPALVKIGWIRFPGSTPVASAPEA
ncbi:MAG: MMPL family transporter [Planctomycetes bacterium]|nr:MMPL family transporter [Planctomycetota bacterium]